MAQERLRELVGKWNREADGYGNYSMKETKRSCARELEQALVDDCSKPRIVVMRCRECGREIKKDLNGQWVTSTHGGFLCSFTDDLKHVLGPAPVERPGERNGDD